MSGLLRLNARAYGAVLLLYPAELRRDFGLEMRELFGEDLADAWRRHPVWPEYFWSGGALCAKFWRIAIPGQMRKPGVRGARDCVRPLTLSILSCDMGGRTYPPSCDAGRTARRHRSR